MQRAIEVVLGKEFLPWNLSAAITSEATMIFQRKTATNTDLNKPAEINRSKSYNINRKSSKFYEENEKFNKRFKNPDKSDLRYSKVSSKYDNSDNNSLFFNEDKKASKSNPMDILKVYKRTSKNMNGLSVVESSQGVSLKSSM